jgi:hypothetical protein
MPLSPPGGSRFSPRPAPGGLPALQRPDPAAVLVTVDRAGEDHPRGVHIRVLSMAAGRAAQSRLACARFCAHCAAGRARLARVRGWHDGQLRAVPARLVGELAVKLGAALGEDRTVQPALLRNVHARLGERALGRAAKDCKNPPTPARLGVRLRTTLRATRGAGVILQLPTQASAERYRTERLSQRELITRIAVMFLRRAVDGR